MCRFYGMTPADLRCLSVAEYRAFTDYMQEYQRKAGPVVG